VAGTLANHGRQAGWIGSLEPNASAAPLCRFDLGKSAAGMTSPNVWG
jgi:hypothetical protein